MEPSINVNDTLSFQSNELRNSPKEQMNKFNESTRKFNGAKDVSRDFSNSQDNGDRGSISDQAFACSASSVESLPSASGSSKYLFIHLFSLFFISTSFALFIHKLANVVRLFFPKRK